MLYTVDDLKEKLEFCFDVLSATLKRLGKQRLFHRHIQSEAFFRDLINMALDKGLICLPPNSPAIDLYESGTGLCYQITTVDTDYKKSYTLDQLKSLIASGRIKQVSRLVVLALNQEEKELARKKFTEQPPHDFAVDFFNLNDLTGQIIDRNAHRPEKIEELIEFLRDHTGAFYFLRQLQTMEPTAPPALSHYLSPHHHTPASPGALWGLNRAGYVGLYVNRNEESQLFRELLLTEKMLNELTATGYPEIPQRRWFQLEINQLKDPEATISDLRERYSCFDELADSELIGLFLNFRIDPAKLADYTTDIRQWCAAFRSLSRELRGGVSLVFHFSLAEVSDNALEQLESYQREMLRASGEKQIELLISPARREKKTAATPSAADDFWGFSNSATAATEAADRLKPFFQYIFQLRNAWTIAQRPSEQFWAAHPRCEKICFQFQSALRAVSAQPDNRAADLPAMLTALDSYYASPVLCAALVKELLQLSLDVLSQSEVIRLLRACSAALPAARQASLDFALAQKDLRYLENWLEILLTTDQPPVYLNNQKAEKVIIVLLKILHAGHALTATVAARADQFIAHYARNLSPQHPFHDFITLSQAEDKSAEDVYAVISKLSFIQIYQFVQTSLYRKYQLPLAGLLNRISQADQPGYFWKLLYFSQQPSPQTIAELLSTPELPVRGVTGLCSKAEMRSAAYQALTAYIDHCRKAH
ncbi:MAG: SMEK domain-containing protein [Bacteroidota bacterium]